AARVHQGEKPVGGVGIHAVALEHRGVGARERRERLVVPAPLQRAEDEQAVLDERAADPAAELVLRRTLAERGPVGRAPCERAVAQVVGERALGSLVPLRVVAATSPPENWPRATS